MEQRIVCIFIGYRGNHRKSQFTTESLVLSNNKCIFEHCWEFQARKTLLIGIIFATKKISVDLFRAAPYMIMLVLHKDALSHYCSNLSLLLHHIGNGVWGFTMLGEVAEAWLDDPC